ncbi:hypothetical protein [Lewinella sp. IMCC34191]|uniref:hypothetical protein n=1 Tax=Lewinella sp. IMCC34191 TaxID=2259172 RepID=UPI0013002621|nr:hypothetical protein [Lewinella sp. IMCC34191]
MNNKHINNKILVLVGMHRSGTSLTAQWMASCGLQLGDKLLGSSPGNKFGHYEDMDFLEFHEELLAYHGKNYDVTEPIQFTVPDGFRNRATTLITNRNGAYPQWGWKEPRTSLFLHLWDQLIDDSKYLIIYRNFEEVVDSLLRREFQTIKRRRNFVAKYYRLYQYNKSFQKRANHYLRVWIAYNKSIVNFVRENLRSEKILLFDNELLYYKSIDIIDHLIDEWRFNLERQSMDRIYKPGHMKTSNEVVFNFDSKLYEEANAVTEELNEYSKIIGRKINII